MSMDTLLPMIAFAGWSVLWALGGWWIARRVFTLSRSEELLVGLAVGLVLQTLAANLLELYGYCVLRLTQANARNDAAVIDEVIRLIEPIASGWKQMDDARTPQSTPRVQAA